MTEHDGRTISGMTQKFDTENERRAQDRIAELERQLAERDEQIRALREALRELARDRCNERHLHYGQEPEAAQNACADEVLRAALATSEEK